MRHCTIRQKTAAGPDWLPEVSLGGVTIAFDGDGKGRVKTTGQTECPEAVGVTAEKRPQRYEVQWHDGAAPPIANAKVARAIPPRKPEPPTRSELIAAGVSEAEAGDAAAFQRYLHAQQVYPYGNRAMPLPGSEGQLERFRKAGGPDAVPPGPAGELPREAAEEKPKGKPGPKSHADRRRGELDAMVADESGKGEESLRAIAEHLGLPTGTSKREIADAIHAKEFPPAAKKEK